MTIFPAMAAILALSFSAATRLASSPTPQPEATPKAVAVLELFTSEGCSSCPSADALLGKLAEAPSGEVQPIILSYHVDYWNRLGWRDRFSDAAYSTRQYAYAHTLHGDGAYTPQLVVNGHTEFVGSNAGKLQSALKEAAKNSPQVLALSTVRNANTPHGIVGGWANCRHNGALAAHRAASRNCRGQRRKFWPQAPPCGCCSGHQHRQRCASPCTSPCLRP